LLLPPLVDQRLLPLECVVRRTPVPIDPSIASVQCDASPWGCGAILFLQDQPSEYLMFSWTPSLASFLGTEVGSPDGQTTWEYLVVFLSLLCWGTRCREEGLAVMGDNMAALSGAISLKGRGQLTKITREISWRKCRYGWRYCTGHLPAELNTMADALSRVTAPQGADQKSFPHELEGKPRCPVPDVSTWWLAEL